MCLDSRTNSNHCSGVQTADHRSGMKTVKSGTLTDWFKMSQNERLASAYSSRSSNSVRVTTSIGMFSLSNAVFLLRYVELWIGLDMPVNLTWFVVLFDILDPLVKKIIDISPTL